MNNCIPNISISLCFGSYMIAACYEVAVEVVIALAWIIIYKSTTLNCDRARIAVLLIQNIIEPSPIIVCLEESSLNNDVAAITFDNGVSFTFGIASNCKCATLDCNCCTIRYMYTLVITAGSAVECTPDDCNISIITRCFYCNSICIRCCYTSIKSVRSTFECFTFSNRL